MLVKFGCFFSFAELMEVFVVVVGFVSVERKRRSCSSHRRQRVFIRLTRRRGCIRHKQYAQTNMLRTAFFKLFQIPFRLPMNNKKKKHDSIKA